ncbi:ankyrin repeat-containing domain protein [Syncephalis pseudoplumigaleata]|uniref:Ankyrin repeat-containing domain protein n=1 Tax=Syncephalis pseudoplumigaleata TaxID=1712513 RepID=A0A4P9Z493_9FUNG|nr:ankyrin repeat-containing domain protein [Syncephalis pseudoplumigaleata]|eukprot:RKP27316.1 ankyrin repeat-containing domain protein [Syncephalis pseudoplumigaleata]
MKRRSDHCLNATQILKVAGIEKGRRTKILEREVLTGEHEKVQGGYGKYQGTWVPFRRGVELAQQYGVEAYLRPLFDHQPAQEEGSVDKTPTKEQAIKDEQRIALMSIFLSDDPNHMPDVLLNEDSLHVLDVNIVIDDQGHSALHWAASLARLQVVRLLLARGADVMRVNYAGESALIRAVLVTNNYERDTFPQLLRLLGASVLLRDSRNRTVFHHIALHAGIKGRVMAARYYMSCLLSYLIEEEESIAGEEGGLASLLNAQDTNGDTALCVAARVGCRIMMEQLIEAGARRDLHNKYDLGPDDFGVMGHLDDATGRKSLDNEDYAERARLNSRTRTTAGDARSRELLAVVERLVTDMDNDFDTELRLKKEQLLEAQQRLREATHELAEVRGKAQQARARGRHLSQLKLRLKILTAQLEEREDREGEQTVPREDEPSDERLAAAPLAGLRLMLEVYEARDAALKEQIQQLSTRDHDAEKESRYRRLIAACSRVPLTMVDQQLDTLTTAVESDGDALDLERVEDFLRNLPTNSPGL